MDIVSVMTYEISSSIILKPCSQILDDNSRAEKIKEKSYRRIS